MAESFSDSSSELSELDNDQFSCRSDDSPISPPSIGAQTKRRKLRATSTWSYSRLHKNDEPERNYQKRKIFYCKFDGCSFANAITTNIRAHLKIKHGIIVAEEESLVTQARRNHWESMTAKMAESSRNKDQKAAEKALKEAIDLPTVREALAELIVTRNLPYEAVTWPELHSLLKSVNYMANDVLPKTGTAVPQLIKQSFELDREILKKKLQISTSKIHLALDCWSAPNRKTFLAIVAHFVDDMFILRKALLALPYLPGKHGADDQINPLWDCLHEYNILDKLGYIVGHNHGSNDKVVRLLSSRLKDEDINHEYDVIQHRIRCHGHIVNLAVQAFFFCESKEAVNAAFELAKERLEGGDLLPEEVEEVLAELFSKGKSDKKSIRAVGAPGKLHDLVAHIRESNERYNLFASWAGKMIPMDNDTRWNSYEMMCAVALEPKVMQAIKRYQEWFARDFGDDGFINPSDWETLKAVVEFLEPFKAVTKESEKDDASLDQVLFNMDFLVDIYKIATQRYAGQPKLVNCINTSWYVFDKYYLLTDQVTAYGAALLLAPHRRLFYITQNWKTGWRKEVTKKAKALWESQYKDQGYKQPQKSTEGTGKEPSALELWKRRQTFHINVSDEFENFIHGNPIILEEGVTSLGWWLQPAQRKQYPSLSRMAIDILSIPPMSAEPERIFSGARRTITWSRFRLSGRSIEQGECLKSWIRSGIVSNWRREIEVVDTTIEEAGAGVYRMSQF